MRKPKRNPLTAPLRAIAALGALCCSAAPQPAWGADPVSETPPIETHGSHEPIEEIVVTASPLGRDETGTTTAVNVLTREHLLTHGGSTLGEILANEPGIATSGFSPGASRPVIRGQSGFRVKTTEDGLGTADVAALSPDHGVPVNPLMARRVEVLRGPRDTALRRRRDRRRGEYSDRPGPGPSSRARAEWGDPGRLGQWREPKGRSLLARRRSGSTALAPRWRVAPL